MRRVLVPVLALTIAGGTALYVRGWLASQRTDVAPVEAAVQPQPVTTQVLVADVDLAIGTFVRPEQLRWQDWPSDDLPEAFMLRGAVEIEDFSGAVVRRTMTTGQPLLSANVVKPGSRGFLAAVLEPNMRALSVPVNEASSNAGLIFPGDQVDVLLTQRLEVQFSGGGDEVGGDSEDRVVTETVLDDVRIIAMGRRLQDASEGDSNERDLRTATLEVTPEDAEILALVAELGKLSLSLRSLASTDQPALLTERTPTWDVDASAALSSGDGGAGLNQRMTLLRGSATQQITVTGAAR
ncbi:MAG: Flp pilus assembly protein CpaB [Geminicoccaceae bacterium]